MADCVLHVKETGAAIVQSMMTCRLLLRQLNVLCLNQKENSVFVLLTCWISKCPNTADSTVVCFHLRYVFTCGQWRKVDAICICRITGE